MGNYEYRSIIFLSAPSIENFFSLAKGVQQKEFAKPDAFSVPEADQPQPTIPPFQMNSNHPLPIVIL